jgi:signal peptidase II
MAAAAIAAFVVAVDQLTKWRVTEKLGPDAASHRSQLLDHLLAIHYVENTGVAFGLLQGQAVLVTVLAVVVVIFVVRIYRQTGATSWAMAAGCGLIVGGAVGNLVDRIRLGYVVDFVEVSVWPKFNAADTAITIGALLLAWHYLRDDRQAAVNERRRGTAPSPGLAVLSRDGER